LVHALTTRRGGVSPPPFDHLNLGRVPGDAAAAVDENRRRVASALGAERILFPRQVHGTRVEVIRSDALPPGSADAVLTTAGGLLLGVLGADCANLLLVDPANHALALVHAGWRGLVAGVVPAAIRALVQTFGTNPAALRVGVGPAICARHYEVGPDVVDAVQAAWIDGPPLLRRTAAGRAQLDIVSGLEHQLHVAGVDPTRIEVLHRCTWEEHDTFFSHRRDGPRTGRHALVAGWL